MKIISLKKACFLFYLLFNIFACQESEKQEPIQKKHQLPKLKLDSITIFGQSDYFDEVYELQGMEIRHSYGFESITFDSSLQFKYKFESDRPVILTLSTFRMTKAIPIFAMPGDSIKIDINFVDFLNSRQTQKYSGSSSKENHLLANIKRYLVLDNSNYNYMYDTDVPSFLQKIDSLQDTADLLKGNAIKYEGLKNPYFILAYNNYVKYKLGSFLERYPKVYKHSLQLGEPVLNEEYKKRCKDLFQETPENLGIHPYSSFLTKIVYQNRLAPIFNPKKPEPLSDFLSSSFYTIDSLYTNQEVIDQQKLTVVLQRLKMAENKKKYMKRLTDIYTPAAKSDAPQIGKRSMNLNKILGNNVDIDGILEIYQQTNPPKRYFEIVNSKYDKIKE